MNKPEEELTEQQRIALGYLNGTDRVRIEMPVGAGKSASVSDILSEALKLDDYPDKLGGVYYDAIERALEIHKSNRELRLLSALNEMMIAFSPDVPTDTKNHRFTAFHNAAILMKEYGI